MAVAPAVAALRAALDQDGTMAAAWVDLGYCLWEMKDSDGAEKACRKAIELDPTNKNAQKGLVNVLDLLECEEKDDEGSLSEDYSSEDQS